MRDKEVGEMKISDWTQEMKNFMKDDEKKYILFFEMIEQAKKPDLEMLELLVIQVINSVKKKMEIPGANVYNESDIKDAEFLLKDIKIKIMHYELSVGF